MGAETCTKLYVDSEKAVCSTAYDIQLQDNKCLVAKQEELSPCRSDEPLAKQDKLFLLSMLI